MTQTEAAPDPEFAAMQTAFEALEPLEPASRQRVLEYVAARLEISTGRDGSLGPMAGDMQEGTTGEDSRLGEVVPKNPARFGTFAELFDAAQPKTNGEKALVGGYWVQVCNGADSFYGLSINKSLKDLGRGLSNVTHALNALKGRKPALVLQLRKSGKSQQARKTYKVTAAGIEAVETMIGG